MASTLTLYDFQKNCVKALLSGKRIIYASVGTGKTGIGAVWANEVCKRTGKQKVLVVSTASKVKTSDFQEAFRDFVSPSFLSSLSSFSLSSWHSLHKWVKLHQNELSEWVVIADECQRMCGFTSRMAKSFLQITKATQDWAGFTGTPGDTWEKFGAYFCATGLVRNKTHFANRFFIVETYKGFPEIVGYKEQDTLKRWWANISYAPDTSKIAQELPKATHKVVYFSKPKGYEKVLKMRQKLCSDGSLSEDYDDFLDNPSATFHYLRQLCFTKEKQQWLSDFIEGLGENCIIFYNYKETANTIEAIAKKVLPKGAKVWRIDGSHHQIPTKDTIGKYDIVLSQWQSGSEGLNLQFMRVWVSAELTYAYSTAQQARGRVLRKGQTRPVFFFYLQTEDTIETDIMNCLKDKGKFSEKVWLLGQGMIKKGEKYA